ncbi:Probable 26S proteasome regulatory subunit 10B [Aduncisulcus paluster]|uniref:Probable 26S proteasome regulatory subunit 10B n=1 Tax=Aduncisulcus paluster TaxID=2918883 RepID=A0ABQ5KUY7_9EUKA|nr:Probable 26S proteasome regulatory subunit 10B [Aduncisulcus paluster]
MTREELLQKYRASYRKRLRIQNEVKELRKAFDLLKGESDRAEDDVIALQTVGQIVGEFLRKLGPDHYVVRSSLGPRYVVGAYKDVNPDELQEGCRISLDMSTLTIMRVLPKEVDPTVWGMLHEDPGDVTYGSVGGLSKQIRAVREAIELPLTQPELFERVGIAPPKAVLLYGPPGTGKTLLARALANSVDASFVKLVASSIVDKYIGESARMVREIFTYAREHQPCVVFIDEIDAIGGKRLQEGSGADREIQRCLLELLAQLDGFQSLGRVKIIAATNRPDVLDPALLRPGRLDRKVEIPLPSENARYDVLRIHTKKMSIADEVDFEPVVKMSDGFNGADLRNVCTEAGLFAIRDMRAKVSQYDFMRAVRKQKEMKKLETKLEYSKI